MAPTASVDTSPVDALLHSLVDVGSPFAPPLTAGLADSQLLDHQRLLSEVERRVTAASAALAAEVRHRSRPELGHEGLAARLGARTPEKLVQTLTGVTKGRAATLVRIGSMLPTAPPARERSPWMADVAAALASGDLSLDAADAIRSGLGTRPMRCRRMPSLSPPAPSCCSPRPSPSRRSPCAPARSASRSTSRSSSSERGPCATSAPSRFTVRPTG
jgi:hypothetical protein